MLDPWRPAFQLGSYWGKILRLVTQWVLHWLTLKNVAVPLAPAGMVAVGAKVVQALSLQQCP